MSTGLSRWLAAVGVAVLCWTESSGAAGRVRLFVDCDFCDLDYYRTELRCVDFVRDRTEADVHLLTTEQLTGSGGREYTLTFIGRKAFSGLGDTLTVQVAESDTEDEIRAAQLRVIRLGLTRFVSHSDAARYLEIAYKAPADEKAPPRDPWKNWVFTISGGGFFEGESAYKYYSLSGNVSARRVTEALELAMSAYASRHRDEFDTGGAVVAGESRNRGADVLGIFSLTDHWSAAADLEGFMSTWSNQDLCLVAAAGIEYNIYPYRMSTRRQLRLMWIVKHLYNDYREVTIYDRTTEHLFQQEFAAKLEVTQPWGSAEVATEFAHYLRNLKYNHLTANGELSLRIVGGLSLDIWGSVSRVRDQLSLPRGDASYEEILLRRRQLETSYSYYMSIGLSYTFGSIYNNIVNPRFGD